MALLNSKQNACGAAWWRVWDRVEVCRTGRAGGGMHCLHGLPPRDGVTSLQEAPREQPGCKMGGDRQSVLSMGLGMAWGATYRACRMRFTARVKPCLLEWEEGTSPGAKMSVTLLRSYL